MTRPLKTILVGLGRIGAAYIDDKTMAKTVPYVTHAQVLTDHPDFRWEAAVDISDDALELVKSCYCVEQVARSVEEIDCLEEIDVVVLATPPSFRLSVLDALPNLKAVIVEKPLGSTLDESRAFVRECKKRGILTQVNLTRRTDAAIQELLNGGLKERIGSVQCGFGVYGHGIINYATHIIDLVRMLVGEVTAVQALKRSHEFREGPLANDKNLSFTLFVEEGTPITLHPLRFSRYREGSLDLWGEKGRLEVLQEGLIMRQTSRNACRSLDGAFELDTNQSRLEATGYGRALYDLYGDLADVINGERNAICSPSDSAIITEQVVHAALRSATSGGSVVEV